MKRLFLIIALLFVTRDAFSDEVYLRVFHSDNEEELDVASLPKEARDRIAWVRPGLARSEIEKYFEQDGGLFGRLAQSYCLKAPPKHGKFVKLEMTFQPADMPDAVYANRDRANEWARHHKIELCPTDILRGTSKPYLQAAIID